ncbi:unnamed protein product [Penicillium nalgiovense]|nr:unnamed protein product [Penicillium nalgiovense]
MSKPTSPQTPQIPRAPTQNILLFLIAFRLVNAFAVRTFFQPDEYFQSLEPAWQIAFGQGQGAWVTWEWRHQLRSSLHPLFFAALYKFTDFLASALSVSPATRAELLIAAPKTAQAVVAAIGDFYTWKLAVRVYGDDSRGSWTTLVATVLNPWQWFCSTRTLSNCLETTLTIVALELWPWQWSAGSTAGDGRDKNTSNQLRGTDRGRSVIVGLHQCLPLAALACILRPTNILVWATLAGLAWLRTSWPQRKILIFEAIVCGSAILAVSSVADRLFYGIWTFPPLRFLYFNIAQSLAVFYGSNDWHYYISQGYPLLLTTLLPAALVGLYRTLATRKSTVGDSLQAAIRVQLATVCLLMPFVLSLISHKEVRFIYPLLPCLHILAAPPLVQFFYPAIYSRAYPRHTPRRLILIFLVLVNVVIALYTTLHHASGTLRVLSYLRQQHEAHSVPTKRQTNSVSETGISAGFLMPCHSTPWRSNTERQLQQSRDKQFDRIVEAFKNEGRKRKKKGWMGLHVFPMPWSSSPPSLFASWRRSVESLFSSPSRSSISWPWRPASRWETFAARLSFSKQKTSWLPSWVSDWLPGLPSWLGGAERRPTEAELWS